MVDRRCIVTGASSGIGKEIARNLAYFGASVVLACRDRDRGSATLHEIVTDSGNENVTMMQVDLGHRQSIRAFVKNVTAGGPVHVLVNNAAVLCADRRVSPDPQYSSPMAILLAVTPYPKIIATIENTSTHTQTR